MLEFWEILKSGAGYLPIDTNVPIERMQYMLKDSAAKLLLVGDEVDYICKKINSTLTAIDINELQKRGHAW